MLWKGDILVKYLLDRLDKDKEENSIYQCTATGNQNGYK